MTTVAPWGNAVASATFNSNSRDLGVGDEEDPLRHGASTDPFISAGSTSTSGGFHTADEGHPNRDFHHSAFDSLTGRSHDDTGTELVFPLIQRIRREVLTVIDTALTYDQLKAPKLNFSIVRPLTLKLSRGRRPPTALLYALLVNRVQFTSEAEADLAFSGVNSTRADLCELLAVKLLPAYRSAPTSLELLHVLTTNFSPFDGLTSDMLSSEDGVGAGEDEEEEEVGELKEWGKEQSANALELAVFSGAKRFVRSPLVQQVITAIYQGTITYRPEGGTHSLLRDDFKSRPVVEVYDWSRQPFLDHYRLRVPAIRNRLEFLTYLSIILLFLLTATTRSLDSMNIWEVLFCLWSIGFSLDELASLQENGVDAYLSGVYNLMDSLFVLNFYVYFFLRLNGLWYSNRERSEFAFDTLSLAGCILFRGLSHALEVAAVVDHKTNKLSETMHRMSISLIKGNIVLLALTAMVKEFIFFMALACLTGGGFLISFKVLARDTWGLGRISWLMLKIWLGSAFLGFEAAQDFHPVYGPFLMVVFAILTQTLLLTILISLLSNTFAAVQANADTEILNQKALRTMERVKSDAMTSYTPPLNLLAFAILFVSKLFLSPRMFHKLNVLLIKTLNLPTLLFLALWSRYRYKQKLSKRNAAATITRTTQRAFAALPRGIAWDGTADGLGKVFEREVTVAALKVDSMDAQSSDEDDTPQQRLKAKTYPDPRTLSSPARGVKPRVPDLGRGQTHDRMGSLASPLAKVFATGADAILTSPQSRQQQLRADSVSSFPAREELSPGVVARLEAIEASLAILVGEVTRTQQEDEVKAPPLTSLTGAREQLYTSTLDE